MSFFERYKPQPKEYTLSTGDKVTLIDLSLAQMNELNADMLLGVDEDGQPKLDMKAALKNKHKKISMALVNPEMTLEEIEALGNSAKDILQEIYALIDPEGAAAEQALLEKKAGVSEGN